MDDRKLQCKLLKKAYKKQKGKTVRLWKVLWFVGLLMTLGAGAVWAYVKFFDSRIVQTIQKTLDLSGILKHADLIRTYGLWVCAAGAVLWITAWSFWLVKAAATRKTPAYLDWRTMKTALDAEIEER